MKFVPSLNDKYRSSTRRNGYYGSITVQSIREIDTRRACLLQPTVENIENVFRDGDLIFVEQIVKQGRSTLFQYWMDVLSCSVQQLRGRTRTGKRETTNKFHQLLQKNNKCN